MSTLFTPPVSQRCYAQNLWIGALAIPVRISGSSALIQSCGQVDSGHAKSALCTKCPVAALAGYSLSVTATVRTKGRRPLVLACDIVTKLSASHRGVRTSEGVDLWSFRAMSIAVETSAADVSDNRPLSDGSIGRSLFPEIERQLAALAHGPRERWLVDGYFGPRSDDDAAVNGDASYRFG
jgi:hypothetical protein